MIPPYGDVTDEKFNKLLRAIMDCPTTAKALKAKSDKAQALLDLKIKAVDKFLIR